MNNNLQEKQALLVQEEQALMDKIAELQAQAQRQKEETNEPAATKQSAQEGQEATPAQPQKVYLTEEEFERRLKDITGGATVVGTGQATKVLNLRAGYECDDWRNHYNYKSVQSHVKYGNLVPLTPQEQLERMHAYVPRRAMFDLDAVLRLPIAPWKFSGGDKPARTWPKKYRKATKP